MIKISGAEIDMNKLAGQYPPASIVMKIVNILQSSHETYKYDSIEQLKFELEMRKSIMDEAKGLYRSRLRFKDFRDSECNTDFWTRTDEGGFLLKDGIKPYDAIKDIYMNGTEYGTECATAIMIIYYKAAADMFPETQFNTLFPKIYLMDWQHDDSHLDVSTYRDVSDYLPGDCRYFKNPDVDPLHPEWQGENAIDLGNGTYYGHGIGIASANRMIAELNRLRISGSDVSAYLTDTATRPNFKQLADYYKPEVTAQARYYRTA